MIADLNEIVRRLYLPAMKEQSAAMYESLLYRDRYTANLVRTMSDEEFEEAWRNTSDEDLPFVLGRPNPFLGITSA
jgi:hypothetical protein